MISSLKIGTRGSKLALIQTEMLLEILRINAPDIEAEIVVVKTDGDWSPKQGEVRLDPNKGGKGQFISAIENKLLAGEIDLAVHSLKDVPSDLPDNAAIDHFLPGGDEHDVFVSDKASSPDDLPAGAVIGTASLRRQALIQKNWPDLKVEVIRGNVPTRMEKMKAGQVDGLILAAAGVQRLGLNRQISCILEPDLFVPCGGQGIIAIERRKDSNGITEILNGLCCHKTAMRALVERGCLAARGGSCHTPIGINARQAGSTDDPEIWEINGYSGDPQGRYHYIHKSRSRIKTVTEAWQVGTSFAKELLTKMDPAHISELGLQPGLNTPHHERV